MRVSGCSIFLEPFFSLPLCSIVTFARSRPRPHKRSAHGWCVARQLRQQLLLAHGLSSHGRVGLWHADVRVWLRQGEAAVAHPTFSQLTVRNCRVVGLAVRGRQLLDLRVSSPTMTSILTADCGGLQSLSLSGDALTCSRHGAGCGVAACQPALDS
jgi:hypothetical protein